jgi:hypothetical protein
MEVEKFERGGWRRMGVDMEVLGGVGNVEVSDICWISFEKMQNIFELQIV